MTPFEQSLAAFEQWTKMAEPKIAPAVSAVIQNYYRSKVNFSGLGSYGDAPASGSSSTASTTAGGGVDWQGNGVAPSSSSNTVGPFNLPTAPTSSPAVQTTNILQQLFATASNLVNNKAQANQQLAILQGQAAVASTNAAGAAATQQTMLLAGAAVLGVVVVALLAGGGRRR